MNVPGKTQQIGPFTATALCSMGNAPLTLYFSIHNVLIAILVAGQNDRDL